MTRRSDAVCTCHTRSPTPAWSVLAQCRLSLELELACHHTVQMLSELPDPRSQGFSPDTVEDHRIALTLGRAVLFSGARALSNAWFQLPGLSEIMEKIPGLSELILQRVRTTGGDSTGNGRCLGVGVSG